MGRKIFLGFAIAAGLLPTQLGTAGAQDLWCSRNSQQGSEICGFKSHDLCMASQPSGGRGCAVDPASKSEKPQPIQKKKKRTSRDAR
jgi:hypothetical protein